MADCASAYPPYGFVLSGAGRLTRVGGWGDCGLEGAVSCEGLWFSISSGRSAGGLLVLSGWMGGRQVLDPDGASGASG